MPAIPEHLRRHLLAAEAASKALQDEATKSGLALDFTLDGRFVGDVGELLVAQSYTVDLHPAQQSRHDGTCHIGSVQHGVQVKCRRASDVIDFRTKPDLLLVVEIDTAWSIWSVAYNGPGNVVTHGTSLTIATDGNLLRGTIKTFRRMNLKTLRTHASALREGGKPFPQVPERTF